MMQTRRAASASRAAVARRVPGTAGLDRATGKAHARLARERGGALELLEEDRAGEVIALGVADLGRGLQVGEFLEGFETLRDHRHAERFAQGFDRAQNALAARTPMNIGDEGAVDLDLVRGDVGERRKRGITGAEIVDRDADPDLAQ